MDKKSTRTSSSCDTTGGSSTDTVRLYREKQRLIRRKTRTTVKYCCRVCLCPPPTLSSCSRDLSLLRLFCSPKITPPTSLVGLLGPKGRTATRGTMKHGGKIVIRLGGWRITESQIVDQQKRLVSERGNYLNNQAEIKAAVA
ncbi:hypothetical protein I7I51_02574 [Histoplasma capsulatum]|uniref:Uncharacterized protein n=1 Tax=Ajellomyces capsulatus TaxID=5037 RepID=A0A8A1MA30_AJECA|nr:hypothetical protein I7I51_02574 [Histoplasma capsulatum]